MEILNMQCINVHQHVSRDCWFCREFAHQFGVCDSNDRDTSECSDRHQKNIRSVDQKHLMVKDTYYEKAS